MDGRRIGLLGFGEVGQILAQDLTAQSLCTYDIKFEEHDSRLRKTASQFSKLNVCDTYESLCEQSDVIFSAVTAEQTAHAAKAIASTIREKTWYVDLNSAAPATKTDAAGVINAAGARYVEAAVMSPVPPKRLASPVLLGGPYAAPFDKIGEDCGMSALGIYSATYGKASAAKMCRSILIKGMEALLTEALVTAKQHDVEETVLRSLDDLFPGPIWPELSHYMISRTLEHGERRAEEMREVAKMVAATGLEPCMSLATAQRQDWAKNELELSQIPTLPAMLEALAEKAELENKEKTNEH